MSQMKNKAMEPPIHAVVILENAVRQLESEISYFEQQRERAQKSVDDANQKLIGVDTKRADLRASIALLKARGGK